jgi:hypothetical protein
LRRVLHLSIWWRVYLTNQIKLDPMGGIGGFAKFAVKELSKPHMWPFAVGGILTVVGAAMIPISDEDVKNSSQYDRI